jgi:two-component system sensor histidine kinase KdpD
LSESSAQRGWHRIYLGYAVGVGKTYAMLAEGRRRAGLGEDVVIGLLEPHARAHTVALAAGLERLTPLRVEYRGTPFEELDVAESVARHPDWLLVDELAHTNTAGTAYDKRWQAVDAVLGAGVSVMSTVNVQHVESLNDFVFQVTGVRVRETVPDGVLDRADEIVLVDVPPDELIERLKRGGIYPASQVGSALMHFFRKSSLVALREQARSVRAEHARRASRPR